MNYNEDDIAERYDRGRTLQPGMLDMWLGRIGEHLPKRGIRTIVDLGCGTGRFTRALADHYDADAIGVDPSEKMLDVAGAKNLGARVKFLAGSAESIPLPDGAADLVFMSMIFHHLKNPAKAVSEIRRVLRPRGHVCVRNSTADQRSPYAPFFPGFQEIADKMLPPADRIRAAFEGGGFRTLAHDLVPHQMAANWVELAEKAAHRSDSILLGLPHASFVKGVLAMRAQAPAAPDEFVGMNIDLFVFAKE